MGGSGSKVQNATGPLNGAAVGAPAAVASGNSARVNTTPKPPQANSGAATNTGPACTLADLKKFVNAMQAGEATNAGEQRNAGEQARQEGGGFKKKKTKAAKNKKTSTSAKKKSPPRKKKSPPKK